MTNYEELIARLESRTELGLTINKEAATAIQQLVAERDAAFAMSKCECETNEACANLVNLHAEVTYLEKCVSSHEKDKCSAQESFGKCFTENQKLHKEIATLKSALMVAKAALNDCEGALDECRDYPITYDTILEALAKINEVLHD